jgi:hypothetical protein
VESYPDHPVPSCPSKGGGLYLPVVALISYNPYQTTAPRTNAASSRFQPLFGSTSFLATIDRDEGICCGGRVIVEDSEEDGRQGNE